MPKCWNVIGIVAFFGTVSLREETICSRTAGESETCITTGFVVPNDIENGIPVLALGLRFSLSGKTTKLSEDISLKVDEPGGVEDHSHLSTRE